MINRRPSRRGLPSLVHYVLIAVVFFVAISGWALASPVGSSPDEDFHIANIYCVRDPETCRSRDFPWPGIPSWAADPANRVEPYMSEVQRVYPDLWAYPQLRKLPCFVLNGTNWYAPDASVPADCLNDEDAGSNQPASLDILGYYPSAYYQFLAPLTLGTIRSSVVAWRLANCFLAVLLASLSLSLTLAEHRRSVGTAMLVSSVPLGLFLVSSINPSSWSVIGLAAAIGPALALVSRPWTTRRSVPRLAFVLGTFGMVIGARTEGALLVAVATATLAVLAWRLPRTRRLRAFLLLGCGAAAMGAAWLLLASAKMRDALGVGLQSLHGDPGTQTLTFWDALLQAPGLYAAAHNPALGWLEIGMPAAVAVLGSAAFWGAGFFGLSIVFRRKMIALGLLTVAMLVLPAALLPTNPYLQPRYVLPLVYLLAFLLLVTPARQFLPAINSAQRGFLVAALGIANSLALLQVTVRYVSGLTPGATDPRAFAAHPVPDWWWDYWLSPFANWVLGSVAFALGCFLLLRNPGPLYPRGPIDGPSQSTVEKRPAGADAGPLVATETPDPSGAAVSSADG